MVIQVYITSGSSHVEELRGSSDDVEKDASLEDSEDTKEKADVDAVSDAVVIMQGRPDVLKILEAEVAAAAGPMSVDGNAVSNPLSHLLAADNAIIVAGPSTLLEDTRKALTADFAGPGKVMKGTPTVQLNIEEFSM